MRGISAKRGKANLPDHMKVPLLIASLFLVALGCGQKNSSDPLLRQQLIAMIADLRNDRAVPRAISELDAIIAVNSSRLTIQQREKLSSASDKLRQSDLSLGILEIEHTPITKHSSKTRRSYSLM